jgi:hypothetical protein
MCGIKGPYSTARLTLKVTLHSFSTFIKLRFILLIIKLLKQ